MAFKRVYQGGNQVHFCTLTCYDWKSLISLTHLYDFIFQVWFRKLLDTGCKFNGYVIMPNHMHLLLFIPEGLVVNTLMKEGKRFMAYEIINRLKHSGRDDMLFHLAQAVSEKDKAKGQKHNVFRPNFDIKPCFNEEMMYTKLNYIHLNPIKPPWKLTDDWTRYPYSSARFHEHGLPCDVPITLFRDL